jgi:DNA-binding transcriptional LysR family regulator
MATATSVDSATRRLLQQRLKIRHLVLLAAIAEHRSISKASSALGITQSATTKTLRDLEDSLEVSLFTRSARGVTATVFGQSLITYAKAILSEVHNAANEINELKAGSAGRIVIGILRVAAPGLLPNALVQCRAEYPNIRITVVEGTYETLRPKLQAGEIDLLVGYLQESLPRQDLTQERLYVEAASLVVRRGHPLEGAGKNLSLKDLADQQWILPLVDTVLRRHIDAAFRAAGCEPPVACIESHATVLIESVLMQTDLIAAVPHQIALHLQQFNLLAILPASIDIPGVPVGITTAAVRPLKPAARTLVDILRRVAKKKDAPKERQPRERQPRRRRP